MYILTTELRSGHMVEEGCCSADFRINHSSWWNTDQGSVVIGNLIQMLLGNEPRCGRKWTSTRTINSLLLSQQSLPKHREILHLGKWKVNLLCFYAPLVLSTMWTTHLAWCWTSWRRLASACWQWRGWDRRWCGASTRIQSDRSVDCTKIPGEKKLAMYVSAKHRCVRVYVSQFFFSMLNFQFYVSKTCWWSASVWAQKPLG